MSPRRHSGRPVPAVPRQPLTRPDERSDVRSVARRMLPAGVVLLSAAALVGSHLYVRFHGLSYRGPLLVVDHLFDLSLALALLAVCAGVGRLVLRRCEATFDQPLEDLSFSTALGSGILAASILVCGALSALRAPVLVVLLLSWGGLILFEVLR